MGKANGLVATALADALTMLEEISRGKTYDAHEYFRRIHKMRRALEEHDPQAFEEWLQRMGY